MNTKTPSKAKHLLLWSLQWLLAALLLWAAGTKLFTPAGKLASMWPWTADNATLVILTAIFDLLGALGLVLPPLLRLRPVWTRIAASGIVLLMIVAIAFHLSRGEGAQIGINIAVGLMAAVIAVWRR